MPPEQSHALYCIVLYYMSAERMTTRPRYDAQHSYMGKLETGMMIIAERVRIWNISYVYLVSVGIAGHM